MKLLTQPNPTNRGKITRSRAATALVLLSALLPFANNFVKNFFDTTQVVFNNISGARTLDLDSCIFFLSMPFAYLFIFLGVRNGAHKYSFYTVYVSCYFQLAFLINFIFLDVNTEYMCSHIALLVLFVVMGIIFIRMEKQKEIEELQDLFKDKTLDRYSSIITKKNNDAR